VEEESTDESRQLATTTNSAPPTYVPLGSLDPDSGFDILVVANSLGATLDRIELNHKKYRDLGSVENRRRFGHKVSGYMGPLALEVRNTQPGVVVRVIGPGTPAETARPLSNDVQAGMQVNDVILTVDDEEILDIARFQEVMGTKQPGQKIKLDVQRIVNENAEQLQFEVELEEPPLAVVRPEMSNDENNEQHFFSSFSMTLEQIGSTTVKSGDEEILNLPSLRNSHWQVTRRPSAEDTEQVVEFTMDINAEQLQPIGETGGLRIVRRYRLAKVERGESIEDTVHGYHVYMDLEIQNLDDTAKELAYRLDGPVGLPIEGWWYSYKVHPHMWARAGARDVIWRTEAGHELFGCTEISKQADKNPQSPMTKLNTGSPAMFRYAGVDTQYFAAVLKADVDAPSQARPLEIASAVARPVGPVSSERWNLTNVSFQLISQPKLLEPQEKLTQNYVVFAGPKDPTILTQYGLQDVIIYGWFAAVAKLMSSLLHTFFWVTTLGGIVSGSYALAIIMLTVLVRGCMFPLGRKQAQMAAKMQELAPEMKKIAEQYKNDMEKKAKAQQELFKRHNYNPLSGCFPMLIQLPIFIGLYRSLSVDIELRGAPMFSGLSWCSNLASPDQLFFWQDIIPDFLSKQTGFLGPYFNILPLVTVAFFMIHQKLFTPPATDDQTKMQHQMMKFMMIFMGVIFFKVAAGLCIYIVASSAWGVAERLLLPKAKPKDQDTGAKEKKSRLSIFRSGSNGSSNSSERAKHKKKKAKGKR